MATGINVRRLVIMGAAACAILVLAAAAALAGTLQAKGNQVDGVAPAAGESGLAAASNAS